MTLRDLEALRELVQDWKRLEEKRRYLLGDVLGRRGFGGGSCGRCEGQRTPKAQIYAEQVERLSARIAPIRGEVYRLRRELNRDLRRRRVPELQAAVLSLWYGQAMNAREIGAEIGRSRSRVYSLLQMGKRRFST